ncbi:MAG: VWA domain-containing protein [Nitrospira defluvii]|nr:VWA domain-containing protein [Nitrospira defluvii]
MTSGRSQQQLRDQLSVQLGQDSAIAVVNAIIETVTRQDAVDGVLVLLDELTAQAPKAAKTAIDALAEMQRRGVLADVIPWLDLGVAIAADSGASALRFFKESPLLLGLLDSSKRKVVLETGLELADRNANVAVEFIRIAPEAVGVLPSADWSTWMELACELAETDFALAVEYIRQIPSIARVLSLEGIRSWVQFGTKLIVENSLGKPDYLGALEFFRTSPAILDDIPERAQRNDVIRLGAQMAERSPEAGIAVLSEAPTILRRLPTENWRTQALQYGLLVAERDAETALVYIRRCPELVALIGAGEGAQEKFQAWFASGMEVLEYSLDGGRAYFAMETGKALGAVSHALSGVPLRQIARRIKLFAQALCGRDLRIYDLPDSLESGQPMARATVSEDGRSIGLPSIVRRYPTFDENVRLYMVMATHEAGHLEFGTFDLSIARLQDLVEDLGRRYGHPASKEARTLGDVFARYPQPGLIRDLWALIEDARVEYLLRAEYPGLSRDLAAMAKDAVNIRTLAHGMTVRELVVDQLLLFSTAEAGSVTIPAVVKGEVDQLWALCQTIFHPSATAEGAVRLADRLYVQMDELLAIRRETVPAQDESDAPEQSIPAPKSSEDLSDTYRPMDNWDYRGAMDPNLVRDRTESSPEQTSASGQGDSEGGAGLVGESGGSSGAGTARSQQTSQDVLVPGRRQPSLVEEVLAVEGEGLRPEGEKIGAVKAVRYHEWDAAIQDYRMNWCRVVEREALEGSSDFVEATLAAQGGTVRLLRRYFESLRPPGLRRLPGQLDGEDLDMDAVIGRLADLVAGIEPSERIYVRREKRERDVAAAFLVDLSGSTSRQVDQGRRIIDVEKQGLVLLCEALTAIGDQFALYGYSGQGRHQVDFLVVKAFDELVTGRAGAKLGGIVPLQQNRDGAAIRHATSKLLARQAKTRILVIISDGRPLDDGYKEDYSLEDTRMALREARASGIEPVCITIDKQADPYLRRMYGDVRYVVIDRVEGLPEKLPRIYHRLTA